MTDLRILPASDKSKTRLVRIPPDYPAKEAYRHVTGLIAQVEERDPDYAWDDVLAALDHAHNPPPEIDSSGGPGGAIVHRDISPSNVLISRHGEIMLSDFGVAKAVTGTARQQSAVKGKIPYMSPEQLRLEPLDGRADLFGVVVVLFEALCGKRPYSGGHDPATILLILQGDHEPLASLAPGAPPELCAIIDGLIEPQRDNRPDSAAALIELLDPFVPSPRLRRQLGKRPIDMGHELLAAFTHLGGEG